MTGQSRRISELAEELADAVPSLIDRIVEHALLAELDQIVDPLLLPWSFAYRRGLGVKDALACLVEARESGWTVR